MILGRNLREMLEKVYLRLRLNPTRLDVAHRLQSIERTVSFPNQVCGKHSAGAAEPRTTMDSDYFLLRQ